MKQRTRFPNPIATQEWMPPAALEAAQGYNSQLHALRQAEDAAPAALDALREKILSDSPDVSAVVAAKAAVEANRIGRLAARRKLFLERPQVMQAVTAAGRAKAEATAAQISEREEHLRQKSTKAGFARVLKEVLDTDDELIALRSRLVIETARAAHMAQDTAADAEAVAELADELSIWCTGAPVPEVEPEDDMAAQGHPATPAGSGMTSKSEGPPPAPVLDNRTDAERLAASGLAGFTRLSDGRLASEALDATSAAPPRPRPAEAFTNHAFKPLKGGA